MLAFFFTHDQHPAISRYHHQRSPHYHDPLKFFNIRYRRPYLGLVSSRSALVPHDGWYFIQTSPFLALYLITLSEATPKKFFNATIKELVKFEMARKYAGREVRLSAKHVARKEGSREIAILPYTKRSFSGWESNVGNLGS